MNIIKRNYHWIIAAVILLELGVCTGITNVITNLCTIPITTELGISRGSFSLASSARNLLGFFSTLVSGIFLIKYGFRKLATIALLVIAGAYTMLGNSQSVWMVGLASAIIGLADGFCGIAAASRMVNIWFHTHQGLVLGLITAATGLGGSVFSIVLSNRIEAAGWRACCYLCTVLIAVAAILLFVLVRNRPADIDLLPYGRGNRYNKKPKKDSRDHWYGYEPKDVFRKPTFYLMAVVVFLSGICVYAAYLVLVPHLQDCGMSAPQAATVQSVLLLALAVSKLVCGLLSDQFGIKATTILCMVCSILGLILLTFVDGYFVAVLAVLIFSIGLVIVSVPIPLLSSALFGYHPQGSIVGIFMALVPASSMIILPVVNTIYDHIGSYRPIFLTVSVVGVVTLGLTVLLFLLAKRDRVRFESSHPEQIYIEEC